MINIGNLIMITIIISANKLCRALEIDADFDRFAPELISSKGYPVETHYVETEDHYILAIHRIPNGNGYKGSTENKSVAFLQHGLVTSSTDYIINAANQSLGFLFYDLGYDVWMGNFRGNVYSRNHSKINPNNPKFWLFSFDQMGLIDLPTMVDYALATSGQEKLTLVGDSLGSATSLIMLSEKPQYQLKMRAVVLLVPMTSLYYANNPAFILTAFRDIFIGLSITSGVLGEILPNTALSRAAIKTLCGNSLTAPVCLLIHKTITESNKYLNQSRVPVYMSHYPSGTSSNTLTHCAQMKQFKGPVFQKFDYGIIGNLINYGQISPPRYYLSKIDKIKVALFTSIGDPNIIQADVNFIRENMKNQIALDYVLNDTEFTHFDFVESICARKLIYSKLFDYLKNQA